MKITLDITPEEERKLRQLNPKAFVSGTAQRAMLDVLARAFEKLEERQFLDAVAAYAEGP